VTLSKLTFLKINFYPLNKEEDTSRHFQTLQLEFKLEEQLQVGNKKDLEGQGLLNSIISHIISADFSSFSTKETVGYC